MVGSLARDLHSVDLRKLTDFSPQFAELTTARRDTWRWRALKRVVRSRFPNTDLASSKNESRVKSSINARLFARRRASVATRASKERMRDLLSSASKTKSSRAQQLPRSARTRQENFYREFS
ncbi:hypothetical protein D6817_05430 [Candidatus Pacearchaeota archaeon]|nr:MAG: hypothetical protein D6817_05430 [Candidatus Pacearchaeota archaeon]